MFRNYFGVVILISRSYQIKKGLLLPLVIKILKRRHPVIGALVYHAGYSAIIMMTII